MFLTFFSDIGLISFLVHSFFSYVCHVEISALDKMCGRNGMLGMPTVSSCLLNNVILFFMFTKCQLKCACHLVEGVPLRSQYEHA